MLTNKIEPTKEMIPHEDGEWISFALLSWSQLEEAGRLRTITAMEMVKLMPVGELQNRINQAENPAEETDADPETSYDKAMVLNASIKAWSYDDPVTRDNIAALDDQTAEWAFDTAIAMNTRSKSEGEGSAPSSNATILEMGAIQPN